MRTDVHQSYVYKCLYSSTHNHPDPETTQKFINGQMVTSIVEYYWREKKERKNY